MGEGTPDKGSGCDGTAVSSRPILICGVPRSGTTWVGQVLGHAPGCRYVHEPDNHHHRAFALWAKRGLGSFPALDVGESGGPFSMLWDAAFANGPGGVWAGVPLRVAGEGLRRWVEERLERYLQRTPGPVKDRAVSLGGKASPLLRLISLLGSVVTGAASQGGGSESPARPVVKSVQAMLSLQWIKHKWNPIVVFVRRDPVNVVASWLRLGWDELGEIPREVVAARCRTWGASEPPAGATKAERIAWRVGFLECAVASAARELAATDPEATITFWHELACRDPVAAFRELFETLELEWTSAVERFIRSSNRPGYGYDTHRIWTDPPRRWQDIDRETLGRVRRVLSGFSPELLRGSFGIEVPPR